MINYIDVINDMNADNYEEFGMSPMEDGFEYTYRTNGNIDIIEFHGVEIFNSENYEIKDGYSISEMSIDEFEDYLEERVMIVGLDFLKYSYYMPHSKIN